MFSRSVKDNWPGGRDQARRKLRISCLRIIHIRMAVHAKERGHASMDWILTMSEVAKEKTYNEAEIKACLEQELPRWVYEGGWICRTYRTTSWKGTLMVINTVGHLAEAAWHHPDLTASYAWVEVRLQNHAAKGITDKDFELAKKIEEVVLWQPGKAGGALEGTPSDQRFAYIDYKKS